MAEKLPQGYYDPAHYTLVHNRHLRSLQSRASRLKHPNDAHCAWIQDKDGLYDTSCGNKFCFIDDGPNENGMVYCCYCGRILTVEQPQAVDAVARADEGSTGQPPRVE